MITSGRSTHSARGAESGGQLSGAAAANIRRWLTEPPFANYRDRLLEDIEHETVARARRRLLHGARVRHRRPAGKMYPVGTNVLNERTIAESARGLADYVTRKKGEGSPRSCVIAHDTRHHSARIRRVCAGVLAAAGFRVFLVSEPRRPRCSRSPSGISTVTRAS